MPRGLIEVNAEALRSGRERAGFSVDDVSRRTGIAPATLRRIEAGPAKHVRPSTLRKLAQTLGVEPEQLSKGA
jgi:transcriptional regulator with XRE-family HTH domain